ncbi:MAG: hypothetical protein IANPNBLG_03845 [Bryobacteraceae bacterium]|nr:hypothetical protein [Bryobacteraceae bacterium]
MRLLFFLLSGVSTFGQTGAPREAVQWTRWEMKQQARVTPEDPYSMKFGARFRGPGGQRIDAPGFYAGSGSFRVRVAFPSPGAWTWETFCDQPKPGLDGRRGRVQVRRYTGENPLYRHGFVTVRPGGRYLVHRDGAPFLWMGDTAWFAAVESSPREWAEYLSIRARQRFSAVQISVVRGLKDAAGPPAFDASGRPEPAYWDNIDGKVKEANARGLLILMAGLGRPDTPAGIPYVSRPEFARYLAARFFGDHVVFSPNFDDFHKPVYDTVAVNLRAATSLHLITQHPGTRKGQNEIYLPRPYLSFTGLQSGHHRGRLELTYGAAREWPLNLWASTPVRPVINIEAMYDGRGNDEGGAWREKDARKLGWISWLSGALGYTYGAGESGSHVPGTNGGVWRWCQEASAHDYWRKAVAWNSAAQMTVLRDFFASIEWWRLEPAHQVVAEPAPSNLERAVFAWAADRSFGIAYMPLQRLTLDLGRFPGPVEAVWINPRSGGRIPVAARLPNRGTHRFDPPEEGEDWALLLRTAK